jgi:purine nucleosidase
VQRKESALSAAEFLVEAINASPGEITVLALAACTNIAHAMQRDPTIHTKWKELVILGGAFQVSGNVSPAAEANILGDPEAADFVLAVGENVWMVGLDVTHSCVLTGEQVKSLKGERRFGKLHVEFWCLGA